MCAGSSRGALLEFKPQGFDKIDPSFKDANGAFVAVQINAHAYAYNPNLVKPEDVPRSALDFLNPRFKGKVVSCYPADDDATLYAFYSIVQKYGWSYMDRYMANQPNFIQGHLGVVRSIASGENLVTFDTIASISMDQKNLGLTQAVAFPQSDPLPIWPFTAAIFKSAPHPNAAKLFLTWYLSPEEQAKTGELVAALRRPRPLRLEAHPLLQGRQQLPRLPHQHDPARRIEEAFRGLHRPGEECGRRAVRMRKFWHHNSALILGRNGILPRDARWVASRMLARAPKTHTSQS